MSDESKHQRKNKERNENRHHKDDEKTDKEQHPPEITQIIDPILLMDEILEKLKLLN